MSVDPVCGMEVDPSGSAGTSSYKGEMIYFCNPVCKERFDADPESFMIDAGTDLKSVPIGMGQAGMGGGPGRGRSRGCKNTTWGGVG